MILDDLRLKLEAAAHPGYYASIANQYPGVTDRLGVPMAAVRRAAADVVRAGEGLEFLEEALAPGAMTSHEMKLVAALVIATEWRLSFPEMLLAVERFMPNVTNWAVCDTLGEALGRFRKARAEGRGWLQEMADSGEPWCVRLADVILLAHYLAPEECDFAFALFGAPKALEAARTDYYASMGLAWAIQTFAARFGERTAEFFFALIESERVDAVTARRTLQKIRDSFRFTDAEKRRWTKEGNAHLAEKADRLPKSENRPIRLA